MADSIQIHQIVLDLITNAYNAIQDEGGKLEVTLKEVEMEDEVHTGREVSPEQVILLVEDDINEF